MAFTTIPSGLDSIAIMRYESRRWNAGLNTPNPGHPLAAVNALETFGTLLTAYRSFDWGMLIPWAFYQRAAATAVQAFSLSAAAGELWQNGINLFKWNPALDVVLISCIAGSGGLWSVSPGNFTAVLDPTDLSLTYSVTGAVSLTGGHVYSTANSGRATAGAAAALAINGTNAGSHYMLLLSKT